MRLINITVSNSSADPRTLKYKVELKDNTGNWNTIHYGKFFVSANTVDVVIDLEDILINNKFQGIDSIMPVSDVQASAYVMPNNPAQISSDYYFNDVRVTSLDVPTAFSQITRKYFFTTYRMFGEEETQFEAGLNIPSGVQTLLPRIPFNPPRGFRWSTLVYNNSPRALQVEYKCDNTVLDTITANAYTPYHIPFAGATEAYFVNDTQVAQVDTCTKPYYLIWIENSGALQCQGFLGTSSFTRKYDNKARVDNRNMEWRATATATGNWTLRSDNLTDVEYKAYGGMYNSPYLVLLDMENQALHYVNISKTDYTEKKRTRVNKKPNYFEVEVASAEHMRV